MEHSFFEDEQFKFTSGELHLLRSKFAFKKIPFYTITKITIKRGVRTKYPIRLLSFGLLIVGLVLYILFHSTDVFNGQWYEEPSPNGRIFVDFCRILAGAWRSCYFSSCLPNRVLKVDYSGGGYDILSLDKLKETNEISGLISFLKENFRTDQIKIDRNAI